CLEAASESEFSGDSTPARAMSRRSASSPPAPRWVPAMKPSRSISTLMGIDGGLIHGRKVGVFHQHDFAIARVLFEVFLDRFLGFTDVDSEKNEPFGGEFLADLVDEGGFVRAVAAPSGPEFKQSYLALDGPIGELFAGRRGGGKTRGGFLFVGAD